MKHFLVLLLLCLACSQKSISPPQHLTPALPGREKTLYERGLRFLSKNDFKDAAKSFSDLLDIYPATVWLSGAYYNWGLALEGLNQYQDAVEKYKKVVELNQASPSRDEAEALYRLSICYEALGDDGRLVLALLQLNDRYNVLPKQTAQMEVPARLAAAYARQGNLTQAKAWYQKAEKELKVYRRPPLRGDVMVWLPKTLYSMGNIVPLKKNITAEEFKNYMDLLTENQSWLVRAGELGNNPWCKKAAENLEDTYIALLTAIKEFKGSDNRDPLIAQKHRQQEQRIMADRVDKAISKLNLERLPSTPEEPEPPFLTEAFKTVSQVEKRLTAMIQAPDVQDVDTPEALQYEGLKK